MSNPETTKAPQVGQSELTDGLYRKLDRGEIIKAGDYGQAGTAKLWYQITVGGAFQWVIGMQVSSIAPNIKRAI